MNEKEEEIAISLGDIISKYIEDDEDCKALIKVWIKMTGGIVGCTLTHEGRSDVKEIAGKVAESIRESIEAESLKINKLMEN